jgi:hypothetical protein
MSYGSQMAEHGADENLGGPLGGSLSHYIACMALGIFIPCQSGCSSVLSDTPAFSVTKRLLPFVVCHIHDCHTLEL